MPLMARSIDTRPPSSGYDNLPKDSSSKHSKGCTNPPFKTAHERRDPCRRLVAVKAHSRQFPPRPHDKNHFFYPAPKLTTKPPSSHISINAPVLELILYGFRLQITLLSPLICLPSPRSSERCRILGRSWSRWRNPRSLRRRAPALLRLGSRGPMADR